MKNNELEAMMLNIVEEGVEKTWYDTEFIHDAFVRFGVRQLYFKALKELKMTKGWE